MQNIAAEPRELDDIIVLSDLKVHFSYLSEVKHQPVEAVLQPLLLSNRTFPVHFASLGLSLHNQYSWHVRCPIWNKMVQYFIKKKNDIFIEKGNEK